MKTADSLVLSELKGLTDEEAKLILIKDGPNELPSQKEKGLFTIAFEVIREPMFILLVMAGAIYLLMGELSDALMLLGFVFVVMGITIVQEKRTERALDALKDLSAPKALVIRNGVQRKIAGSEVVCGDTLVLSEGDRVSADSILRSGVNLSVDESFLTGESVPVRKTSSMVTTKLERPGGDDLSSIYSGTLIISGQGVAEVVMTGVNAEVGKIGKALQELQPESTLLQIETRRLVRNLAILGLILCSLVVVIYAFTRGGSITAWKEGLLAGIAMAMAVLPEEFPVIMTIFLALGAWRISKSRVLTRKMPAIETLGAATVLCVDKTGTLTQNKMTLKTLKIGKNSFEIKEDNKEVIGEDFRHLLTTAIFASKADPFDPMEKAIHAAGKMARIDSENLHPKWEIVREYPLSSELLAVSHALIHEDNKTAALIASKGAPEAIADLCHLSQEDRKAITEEASLMALTGMRVLGVATADLSLPNLPENHHDLDLKFLGLIGLEDPLRLCVPDAVKKCHTAGVRVVMITGDYPLTAQSIARAAGLSNCEKVITGEELEKMSDEQLQLEIKDNQIFARVVPEQKLRIVTALKANNEIVAMTGDGVNDAPALKAAHIGIAMGGRGTDVARESASLVLLDDDFSSIVAAIELGRRIFDNIKKAVAFTFAVHVPIAGLSMLPVFFSNWPLLLLPVHIVFLELIIDPSCTLIFEAEDAEADIMNRPPRNPKERLFSFKMVSVSLLQGFSTLLVCVGIFIFARKTHSPDSARALTFLTLVVSSLVIILVNRSWSRTIIESMKMPNKALLFVVGGTVGFLGIIMMVPAAQKIFHFEPIHITDMVLSIVAGAVCLMWFEALKLTTWLKTK